ncbi:MAG: transcription elongation factor GreA [Clostridia bacterium]|nr:transcription elongation factor GreA [Clostridia bacterium]
MEEIVLTTEGYKKLEQELDHYIKVKRPEAAEKVKLAREFGDLSENAEYDAAKDEQGIVEARIRELEETLKRAKIIDGEAIDTTVVSVGCFVKLHDLEYDEKDEFKIVGSAEANYAERKISNESVLGAALLGHKKNDVVEVRAPAGVSQFKILNIRK